MKITTHRIPCTVEQALRDLESGQAAQRRAIALAEMDLLAAEHMVLDELAALSYGHALP